MLDRQKIKIKQLWKRKPLVALMASFATRVNEREDKSVFGFKLETQQGSFTILHMTDMALLRMQICGYETFRGQTDRGQGLVTSGPFVHAFVCPSLNWSGSRPVASKMADAAFLMSDSRSTAAGARILYLELGD